MAAEHRWAVSRVGRLGGPPADTQRVILRDGLTFDEADRLCGELTRSVQTEGAHWPWVAYVVVKQDRVEEAETISGEEVEARAIALQLVRWLRGLRS